MLASTVVSLVVGRTVHLHFQHSLYFCAQCHNYAQVRIWCNTVVRLSSQVGLLKGETLTRGFWSVTSVNFLPYRCVWNFLDTPKYAVGFGDVNLPVGFLTFGHHSVKLWYHSLTHHFGSEGHRMLCSIWMDGWIRLIVGFQPLMVISPTASCWCVCTRPAFYQAAHKEIVEHFPGYNLIYTDGSLSGSKAASAAVLGDEAITLRLPDKSSIFTAEMYALLIAFQHFSK